MLQIETWKDQLHRIQCLATIGSLQQKPSLTEALSSVAEGLAHRLHQLEVNHFLCLLMCMRSLMKWVCHQASVQLNQLLDLTAMSKDEYYQQHLKNMQQM